MGISFNAICFVTTISISSNPYHIFDKEIQFVLQKKEIGMADF